MKTSLYTILCIVIRLGAVFLAAGIVMALPNIYIFAHARQANEGSFQLLGAFYLGGLVVALGLWLYPSVLASLAAGRSSKEPFETPIGARDIQYVALSVLGVWLMLKGLVALVFQISRWAAFSSSMPGEGIFTLEGAELASAGAQIIFGIALALGARGLAALLHRLRYGNRQWEES